MRFVFLFEQDCQMPTRCLGMQGFDVSAVQCPEPLVEQLLGRGCSTAGDDGFSAKDSVVA